MEDNYYDFPNYFNKKLFPVVNWLGISIGSTPVSLFHRVFKGSFNDLVSKRMGSYAYLASSILYCFFTIYQYRKLSKVLEEFKNNLSRHDNNSRSFLDDISFLETNMRNHNDNIIRKLNQLAEETEERRCGDLIADLKGYIRNMQFDYQRILIKYRNCLQIVKDNKKWWENNLKVSAGFLVIGVFLVIGCVTCGASLITTGVSVGGLLCSGISTGLSYKAKINCEEMIRLIDGQIKEFKQQKETRFEFILNLIAEHERTNSSDSKIALFREIKQDLENSINEDELI